MQLVLKPNNSQVQSLLKNMRVVHFSDKIVFEFVSLVFNTKSQHSCISLYLIMSQPNKSQWLSYLASNQSILHRACPFPICTHGRIFLYYLKSNIYLNQRHNFVIPQYSNVVEHKKIVTLSSNTLILEEPYS